MKRSDCCASDLFNRFSAYRAVLPHPSPLPLGALVITTAETGAGLAEVEQGLVAAARHDPEAAGRLFDRHYPEIIRYIHHLQNIVPPECESAGHRGRLRAELLARVAAAGVGEAGH